MGAYGNYSGRCAGRLLNILNEYIPMTQVDLCTFPMEDGIIYYNGDNVIKYRWEGDTDFPIFYEVPSSLQHLLCSQEYNIDRVLEEYKPRDLMKELEERVSFLESKLFGINLASQMDFSKEKLAEIIKEKCTEAREGKIK